MKKRPIKKALQSSPFIGRTIAIATFLVLIINQFLLSKVSKVLLNSNGIRDAVIYHLEHFVSDFLIFIIVLWFVLISHISKKTTIKTLNNIIISTIFSLFILDKITVYIFQSSVSIFDISQYISSSFSNFSLLIIGTLLVLLLVFIFIFILAQKSQFKKNQKTILVIFLLFFINSTFLLTIISTNWLKQIPANIISFNFKSIQERFSNRTEFKQLSKQNNGPKYEDFFKEYKWKNKKSNVVLVFAESLSAIDSMHIAWVNNKVPKFDKIQKDGITFSNFIANGCTSDTAHISLLLWTDPVNLLWSHISAYSGYKSIWSPLAQFFNELWYSSTFVSAVDLWFLNQLEFLSWVGFSKIIGPEHFKDEKKYVFNAAPDEALFDETLKIISSQKDPFFVALQTISFHKPYSTPYGNTHDEALKYADDTLYDFYEWLQNIGFFDNGILIIVGDHRKMDIVEPWEQEAFWDSWFVRSLATIVWKDIKSWSINNNLIQITDFFHSIKLHFADWKVNLFSLFNDVFSNNKSRDWWITYCHSHYAKKTNIVFENKDISPISSLENLKKTHPKIFPYFYSYFDFQYWIRDKIEEDILFIWHRGSPSSTTENSLEWFFLAKQEGASWIEFDVSFTKDKKSVIIHGPKTYNTNCGNKKNIDDYNLEDLQTNCILNNWETIKTLKDMLSIVNGLFDYYFLEIKVIDDNDAEQQTLDAIDTVKELNMQDKVIFISYNNISREILWSTEWIIAGWDTFDPNDLELIQNSSFEYFLLPYHLITSELVKEVNKLWKKTVTYTVNTTWDFQEVYEKWINMVMTDNIPLLKDWFQENLE